MKRKMSRKVSLLLSMVMLLSVMSFVPGAEQPVQAVATTYYVSYTHANANDNNAGTDPNSPWRTLAKISGTTFNSDTIKLKSSDTWTEGVQLKGSGTLTYYGGSTKPIIKPSTDVSGILIKNTSDWTIDGIEVDGSLNSNRTSTTDCITIYSDKAGDPNYYNYYYKNFTITNCYLHDWIGPTLYASEAPAGISVASNGGIFIGPEFTNININNCQLDNNYVGIETFNAYDVVIENVTIKHTRWTGMNLAFGSNITTRNCSILDTGGNNESIGGPCGWAVCATNNAALIDSEIGMVSTKLGSYDSEAIDLEGCNSNTWITGNYLHDIYDFPIIIMQNGGPNWRYHITDNLLWHTGYRTDQSAMTITAAFFTDQADTDKPGCVVAGNTIYKTDDPNGFQQPLIFPKPFATPFPENVFPSDITAENNVVMRGYRKVQGPDWYYRRADPNSNTYTNMTFNTTYGYWVGTNGSILGQYDMSKDASYAYFWTLTYPDNYASAWMWPISGEDAAWVLKAPETGTVYVGGIAKLGDPNNSNGVNLYVKQNTTTLWSGTVSGSGGIGPCMMASVTAGDLLYFRASCANQGNPGSNNQVFWTPEVFYVKAPETGTAKSGFSGTQGTNNWYYKRKSISDPNYYNLTSYYPSDPNVAKWYYTSDTSLGIWNNQMAPGSSNDAVRMWQAPSAGTIDIRGVIKFNGASGDGVNITIKKKISGVTTTIYTGSLGPTPTMGPGYSRNIRLTPTSLNTDVSTGDEIYFELNKGASTSTGDNVFWDPIIEYRDISIGGSQSAAFGSTQGTNGWYWQKAPILSGGVIDLDPNHITNLSYWDPNDACWRENPNQGVGIWAGWANPSTSYAAVMTWVAPQREVIKITGDAILPYGSSIDGCGIKIIKYSKVNGAAQRTNNVVWDYYIKNNSNVNGAFKTDTETQSRNLVAGLVEQGDRIYFVADVGPYENGGADCVRWDPKLEVMYTCPGGTASQGYSSTQGANGWYYRWFDPSVSSYKDMKWSSSDQLWVRDGEFRERFVDSKTLGTLRGNGYDDFTGWVGMKIQVGSDPVWVKSLGRIYVTGNHETHTVKIVKASDPNGSTVASVQVDPNGGVNGEFKYVGLQNEVMLERNTQYYIASYETGGAGHDTWYDWDTTITTRFEAGATNISAAFYDTSWHDWGGDPNTTYGPVDFKIIRWTKAYIAPYEWNVNGDADEYGNPRSSARVYMVPAGKTSVTIRGNYGLENFWNMNFNLDIPLKIVKNETEIIDTFNVNVQTPWVDVQKTITGLAGGDRISFVTDVPGPRYYFDPNVIPN